jgi:diguanylate cyclase (GGDEF)-like protein
MPDGFFDTNKEEHFQTLFEYAPISLWEEDYSGIKHLFDQLRLQQVASLQHYLDEHPDFVDQCMAQIKVININQQTLLMFKAASKETLLASLDKVFRDGMRQHLRQELLALWNGDLTWGGEGINYTLQGQPLNISLRWRILPGFEQSWQSVLVSIEDITARKQAELRHQNLFEASPISLWEEDYRALKNYFDELRAAGVTDLREHLETHPQITAHCMSLIKVLNVNHKTVAMFGAKSKQHLLDNLNLVFRDEMGVHFSQELVDLWNGRLAYEHEGINYSLNGEPVQIHLDFRIMPGHEQDFGWVVVAIQDVSARKKAEEYLRYLGTHDVMTGLYNRAYFQETLQGLEKDRREPVSIILADLNGLKTTNDSLGHQSGDNLIRRAAEVFKANFSGEQVTARIGGDEFVVILPGTDKQAAAEAMDRLQELVKLNNKFYRTPELSISLGAATSAPGLSLEKVISLADDAMYRSKAEHHRRRSSDK